MKEFSIHEVHASIKCQFAKRCGQFQSIIPRVADDFISRYSTKQQLQPDFFKQDAAMAHNQLILYSDQCVQAMRKFQFLEVAAEIVSSLTTAVLNINYFLAKQLYHRLRNTNPHVHALTQPLCTGCGRLRQNERLRALKQQLSIDYNFQQPKPRQRESIVFRRGQKYQLSQLLEQQRQNLQTLSEEEIRKRLNKMQQDHDFHQQQIMTCLDQLQRAHERVASYSCGLQNRDHKQESQFNIERYVFSLTRHFFNNLASIQSKIKQLKHSLNPISHAMVQTEEQYIMVSVHRQMITEKSKELQTIKRALDQSTGKLIISTKAVQQKQQMIHILQQKLLEVEVEREHERISDKLAYAQLSHAQNEIKIQTQRQLNNRIKTIKNLQSQNKVVNQIIEKPLNQDLERGNLNQMQYSDEHSVEKIKSALKLIRKQSILFNPRAMLKLACLRTLSQDCADKLVQCGSSVEQLLQQIYKDKLSKLQIHQIINQCVIPHKKTSYEVKRKTNARRSLDENIKIYDKDKKILQNSTELQTNEHFKKDRKKLTKLDIARTQSRKISTFNRQSLITLQERQNADKNLFNKKSDWTGISQQKIISFGRRMSKLQQSKRVSCFKTPLQYYNQTIETKQNQSNSKNDFIDLKSCLKRLKTKKQSNFSRQSSCESRQNNQYLRKNIIEDTLNNGQLFGQKDKQLLLNIQSCLKNGVRLPFQRPEYNRSSLFPPEISYSTCFYSTLAKMHLTNLTVYNNLKVFLNRLLPSCSSQQQGKVQDRLIWLLMAHRKCKGNGSICDHLQTFLQKVKSVCY